MILLAPRIHIPDGCTIGPNGEWIYDTDAEFVDLHADYHGLHVGIADGFWACTQELEGGVVLVLRAAVSA